MYAASDTCQLFVLPVTHLPPISQTSVAVCQLVTSSSVHLCNTLTHIYISGTHIYISGTHNIYISGSCIIFDYTGLNYLQIRTNMDQIQIGLSDHPVGTIL